MFTKVNSDDNQDIAKEYNIASYVHLQGEQRDALTVIVAFQHS